VLRSLFHAILMCIAAFSLFGQTHSPNYQPATVMAVKMHENASGDESSEGVRYDVSLKVGIITYVVLYTPPTGANSIEYMTGMNVLVLVGSDTVTFNSRITNETEVVPILRRVEGPPENSLDPSIAPGQYFSMKLQHLSDALKLTDDQQADIKPVLEQEAGEMATIYGNSGLSAKDKLDRWQTIVRSSDLKLKTFLSDKQWQKLQDMRKQQKGYVKTFLSKQRKGKPA
jgi:hypothetical protein